MLLSIYLLVAAGLFIILTIKGVKWYVSFGLGAIWPVVSLIPVLLLGLGLYILVAKCDEWWDSAWSN